MATATYKQVPVWEGGYGNIQLRTVARNQGEAINNLIDKEPILQAIGCTAEPMKDVDGCKIVALVPSSFEYGDDRRLKAEKARKKAQEEQEAEKVLE